MYFLRNKTLRTQNFQPIDSQMLEYDIPVYSNYAGTRCQWFVQDLVNSVTIGYLVVSHVVILLKAINAMFNLFTQFSLTYSTSNEIIRIMSLHRINSPLQNQHSNYFILAFDKHLIIEISEEKPMERGTIFIIISQRSAIISDIFLRIKRYTILLPEIFSNTKTHT